jgi:hypothetical protein
MALEMRTQCEKCGVALGFSASAFICSYECTFCPSCTAKFGGRCPNCSGELIQRPRRVMVLDTPHQTEIESLLRAYLDGSLEVEALLEHFRPMMDEDGWSISLDLQALPPEQIERGDILRQRLEELIVRRAQDRGL